MPDQPPPAEKPLPDLSALSPTARQVASILMETGIYKETPEDAEWLAVDASLIVMHGSVLDGLMDSGAIGEDPDTGWDQAAYDLVADRIGALL